MTEDEALKAAYLAGFNASGEGYNGEYPFRDHGTHPKQDAGWIKNRDNKLTAIKQARSAPVQEPLTDGYVQQVPDKCDRIVWRNLYFHLPIATPPGAQRPFVGLTDDEIEEMANDFEEGYVFLYRSFARAIEAAHGITAAAPKKGQQ